MPWDMRVQHSQGCSKEQNKKIKGGRSKNILNEKKSEKQRSKPSHIVCRAKQKIKHRKHKKK